MEKPESYFKPPRYQQDAVASDKGWHHPQTGELIVCRKGLLSGRTISQVFVDEYEAIPECASATVSEDAVEEISQHLIQEIESSRNDGDSEDQLLTDTPETVQTVITEIEEVPSDEVLVETAKTNSKKSKK